MAKLENVIERMESHVDQLILDRRKLWEAFQLMDRAVCILYGNDDETLEREARQLRSQAHELIRGVKK